MTVDEVIKAAEICVRCGKFGNETCKGTWKINDKRRAYFEEGESKNCSFSKKRSCYKVLAQYMLAGIKQLKAINKDICETTNRNAQENE